MNSTYIFHLDEVFFVCVERTKSTRIRMVDFVLSRTKSIEEWLILLPNFRGGFTVGYPYLRVIFKLERFDVTLMGD